MGPREPAEKEAMAGNVVIVSPDQGTRMLLGHYLEGLGYEVSIASNLSELLGLVEQCRPDLVVDQRLETSKHTASLALKEAAIDLPVVVLDASQKLVRDPSSNGSSVVIPWPSPRTRVARAVKKLLRKRRNDKKAPASTSVHDDQSEDGPPSERIGRYPVDTLVGRGGMGSVYKCFDETFRRVVAIKTLRCEAHLSPSGKDTNTERFQVEAGALARLVHPRIVATYDFGVDHRRNEMFLVMQYVDGPSLHHRLKDGPLKVAEALRIAWDIADALAHAHLRGVVHRDVKPENVLLNELGEPMLTDFGLALLGNFSVSDFNTVAGTINYMAPEQILCPKTIDVRTDQYGLGAVLHQMLTCAFKGSVTVSPAAVLRSLTLKRPPLDESGVDAPELLQKVLGRMLEPELKDRYPDDDALLDALHSVGAELSLDFERAI